MHIGTGILEPNFDAMMPGIFLALPKLCLLVSLTAVNGFGSWCQAGIGSCVGQRHMFRKRDMSGDIKGGKFDGTIRFADWDGDGDLDLLVVERYNVTHPKIRIFELLDTGELVEMTIKYDHIPLVTSYGPSGLQFFDWNNDGDVDLAVSTSVKTWLFTCNSHGVM